MPGRGSPISPSTKVQCVVSGSILLALGPQSWTHFLPRAGGLNHFRNAHSLPPLATSSVRLASPSLVTSPAASRSPASTPTVPRTPPLPPLFCCRAMLVHFVKFLLGFGRFPLTCLAPLDRPVRCVGQHADGRQASDPPTDLLAGNGHRVEETALHAGEYTRCIAHQHSPLKHPVQPSSRRKWRTAPRARAEGCIRRGCLA